MAYKGVVVMPLTTNLMGGDLRVRIPARDDLQKESEVCVNEIYTIDVSRFVNINEVLTTLSEEEMEEVERKLAFVLGMLNYVDILFG
jgi:mRNA interferase MazF